MNQKEVIVQLQAAFPKEVDAFLQEDISGLVDGILPSLRALYSHNPTPSATWGIGSSECDPVPIVDHSLGRNIRTFLDTHLKRWGAQYPSVSLAFNVLREFQSSTDMFTVKEAGVFEQVQSSSTDDEVIREVSAFDTCIQFYEKRIDATYGYSQEVVVELQKNGDEVNTKVQIVQREYEHNGGDDAHAAFVSMQWEVDFIPEFE